MPPDLGGELLPPVPGGELLPPTRWSVVAQKQKSRQTQITSILKQSRQMNKQVIHNLGLAATIRHLELAAIIHHLDQAAIIHHQNH